MNTIIHNRLPTRHSVKISALAVTTLLASSPMLSLAQEADRTILSGMDEVRLSISGQINRALMVADDGDEVSLFNADNNASSSRVRFIGEASPAERLVVGAALETEFRVNNTFTVSQDDSQGPPDATAFRNRRVEVYADHEGYGKVWLGMGWTATEFVAEQDLSGTALAGYSDPRVMGGGILFRDRDSGELGNTSLADVVDNMDGFSRDTRLRYDTPRFHGFQLRTSVVNQEGIDASLWYHRTIGRVQVASGIGWANANRNGPDPAFDDVISGSLSLLDASGWNITLAAGTKERIDDDVNDEDPTFHYSKLGYQTVFFPSLGRTSLSVDWHRSEDQAQDGDSVDVYGAQAVQNIDRVGTELYLNVRNNELSREGARFEDTLIGMVGARVRF